ncbi:MAG TPA: GatB/YqeY domain-containing protein [Candidatus Omnitrophota bacterium]|nr:GatB/YqeY domain-containing protein [Candidatus Omnitrophota bacterium]
MGSLTEQIEKDVIEAMKAKDRVKVSTLRMLKSALGNYLISTKKDKADDAEILGLITKQAKQRRESIESFEKAGRKDLADKEKAELAILEGYLPKQLSDEELAAEVKKAIEISGAKGPADMGKLMKTLMPAIQGKADGKRVQETVKSILK